MIKKFHIILLIECSVPLLIRFTINNKANRNKYYFGQIVFNVKLYQMRLEISLFSSVWLGKF